MKTIFLKFLSLFYLVFLATNCNNDDNPTSIENINEWVKENSIPKDDLRLDASVITYNNEAFLLPGKGGTRFSSKPEILKYSNNEWTRIATYDGFADAGKSLSIRNNDVIYILGGVNSSNAPTNEVRAYSITNNTFSDETRFSAKANATYTETKAYFGDNEIFSSFDFKTNNFESLPVIPSSESISSAMLTTENNIIYALFSSLETNNFFAFNENSKEWIQLSDFPGGTRSDALIVSTKTDVYTGLGSNLSPLFDIWKYNIETNKWFMFSEYSGTHFSSGFAFELNNQLFFGGGFTGGGSISNDVLNDEVYSIKIK
ncbi:hypothetical protein [uncultured Aquimarina sp.]|uniref:hypothetical protein n=1 Tax=uncultured Aquimarina sp. TaxID=575652 RepID=UPI0026097FA4|nr:hypothetical protein [uncultured Aquimarina sp.]